jgi:hypothetical protein
MSDDPRLTITDMRPLFCVRGIKKELEAAGIDFAAFLRDGAKASELRGIGLDAQVDRVVAMKKELRNGR